MSSFKATCPTCNGPLERRTFIDTWDPDGEPCDISQDLWCPACRLRWMDLKDEPEEAEG